MSVRRAIDWWWLGWALVLTASLARATTVVPPEFPVLVNESDYIVHARVAAVEYRPGEAGAIHTYVTLDVLEVVAGDPPTRPVLRLLGGVWEGRQLRVEGSPEFEVGDEDVLFVRNNGRSLCPLYAMSYGRYRVVRPGEGEPARVLRANGAPLRAAEESVVPLGHTAAAAEPPGSGLELARFIQRIRETVRPGARVAQER